MPFALVVAALLAAPPPKPPAPPRPKASAARKAVAAPKVSPLAESVDRLAADALRDGPAAGLSVAVVQHGQVLVDKGYGLANVELQVPAQAGTVFRIGSITKQFTAAAILQLVEEKKLRLDDRVEKLVPAFHAHGRDITVLNLLTHTAGVRNYTSLPAFKEVSRKELTPPEVLDLFRTEAFEFAPGAHWQYSNSNYHLLGMILEKLSGMPYAAYLAKNVFPRAGLSDSTRYCDDAPLIPGRAQGYAAGKAGLENAEPIGMTIPFAAGGLCSTAADVARWQKALEDGKVVSKESYDLMTRPVQTQDNKDNAYGMGLGIDALAGHRRVAHGGGVNGFASQAMRFPADDVSVVVLVNTEGGVADALADRVARTALDLPERAVLDLPVPPDEASRCSGVFITPSKKRLRAALKDGKLSFGPDGEAGETFLYQGEHVFARKATTDAIRCNGSSINLGDGTHWGPDFPRVG